MCSARTDSTRFAGWFKYTPGEFVTRRIPAGRFAVQYCSRQSTFGDNTYGVRGYAEIHRRYVNLGIHTQQARRSPARTVRKHRDSD